MVNSAIKYQPKTVLQSIRRHRDIELRSVVLFLMDDVDDRRRCLPITCDYSDEELRERIATGKFDDRSTNLDEL